MKHLLVRAGLVTSLVCGAVATHTLTAAAGEGSDGGWPPITYEWCYDVRTSQGVVTVCTPF